ncbi:MAG: IS110 family transposase [Nocardioides sp.]
MDVIHPRCCGMDISKRDAKVCVRIQKGGTVTAQVTTWSAVSSQILKLAAHLRKQRVPMVVMEATGDYWKPFYFLLVESGLEVMLVNARQARQIPGRKTDVADAVWLADLAAHGLLRGSFVPPPPIRELKDLVRARTTLVRLRGQEAQRLEKLLESAAIKLSSTISDIVGLSGRRMIEAMIAGVDDPAALATLADGRVKASAADLTEALTGRFTEHHAFLAQVHLDLIDNLTHQIDVVDTRVQACFTAEPVDDTPEPPSGPSDPSPANLAAARDLLTTIPGVATLTAERIIAEIGIDMTIFPSPAQLTSWAGIAPGANESAGKVKSTRCRPGNTYLKGALGIAALSACRSKDTFLAARYKRVASRRGHHRALIALERAILTAVWQILTNRQPYRELGGDYYIRRRPGRVITKAINQLRTAGIHVTFTTPDTATVT